MLRNEGNASLWQARSGRATMSLCCGLSPHWTDMRIPDWTPERKPQPQDLVQAILERRGGELLNLDRALLWSEPLARGWNTYLKNVRTGLGASRKLRELGICTVALITGAHYEYHHHAPDFLAAGGTQASLDALQAFTQADDGRGPSGLSGDEALVALYAAQMTRDVRVDDALFAQMRERFDTTELVEITAAIATYNMVARFLVALGVSPEE
jgi:alkylhydroperoxidase family enzyme